MKIFVGADHNGFHLKERVLAYLEVRGIQCEDVGDKELDPEDDFPQFARLAALKMLSSSDDDARAILLCGGGQGMCIAANRIKGIRAVVVWDSAEVAMSRRDNDSNVLCLPARILEPEETVWKDIIDTWLETPFSGAARYVRRNNQLDDI